MAKIDTLILFFMWSILRASKTATGQRIRVKIDYQCTKVESILRDS